MKKKKIFSVLKGDFEPCTIYNRGGRSKGNNFYVPKNHICFLLFLNKKKLGNKQLFIDNTKIFMFY